MQVNIMWFRRDLRLQDNAALYHALKSGLPVVPVFIFDRNILDRLDDKADARVSFIHQAISQMQSELIARGSSMHVLYDTPEAAFEKLCGIYEVKSVFTNHDYEPYARERDALMSEQFSKRGISFHTYKDQVIFEKDEVLKPDGQPYTVFTPYSKRWHAALRPFFLKAYPAEKYFGGFFLQSPIELPTLEQLGFLPAVIPFPPAQVSDEVIKKYTERRNFPGIDYSTSHLGVHLRFGTISIRALARKAALLNQTFLNELVWRDFYHMILWHFPHVGRGLSFRAEYDLIPWRNNEAEFARWCEGNTGYPIVDAGMRELNATGFMHNRVRMIVASFLAKHLLIDWRWGEAYFAQKLLDYDLAANNGGWQWASGSGCDAAPYFRVFNPYLQTEKFDPDLTYIKKWVPEFQEFSYPKPMVEHTLARQRAIDVYKAALSGARLPQQIK